MVISTYKIIEKLSESHAAIVYKACCRSDPGRLLTLKVIKPPFLSARKKSRIRHRIEHLKVLQTPAAFAPIGLEEQDGRCFLIQPYADGLPLNKLTQPGRAMALTDFFAIVCSLTQTLSDVHTAGIIHGGIKPRAILVTPTTLEVRLIDFISVLDARDASHFIYDPTFVRHTLAYTSPEQTGRISHGVSFLSDLYALGVVMYELLTGRLPFSSEDPLELIHAHLARKAAAVGEVNAAVPPNLSRIVAKLLCKEPEKRYRSSRGLLSDLLRCRDGYSSSGTMGEFALDMDIRTHRVASISRMVGRDAQAALILDEFEQSVAGQFRAVFISGMPGIGKTRLIQELQAPIVKHRGYFTSGKFDVYQKNIPYNSLIQAFRNLVRTFLTESDERVAVWKRRILLALGDIGRVLTDVLPELEVLIGPQPAVRPLPPVESLNRFRDLVSRFLSCLASEQNPLTLFIDDLQWCDTATFDFLTYAFENAGEHPHLFLLGAYRHNEVDASHPLTRLMTKARQSGRPLREIRLDALAPDHCHEIVAYLLEAPPAQTENLADFVATLTGGNPLFIHESIAYLLRENLLVQDARQQWRWDLDKIRSAPMPTSIVALFSDKIRKMPAELITLLEYCACMGNTFQPADLSLVRGLSLLQIFTILEPALEEGLLTEKEDTLHFIHDRVQEAALSAIDAERRRRIHWQVGSRLLAAARERGEATEKLENLFVIASHLNRGREAQPDAKTAYFLSDINYHAGNKALGALATEAANAYFELSRDLLPADCWNALHYQRTFRIFQKAAKTELMCGRRERSETLLNQLIAHARTDLDKAECLAEQTVSLSSMGSFAAAIETANRGLSYFGRAIPQHPDEVDRRRDGLMAEITAKKNFQQTILDLAPTRNRESRIEFAFYSELIPDLYLCGRLPELYLTAAQATLRCLSTGMDESVIYSLAAIGLHLAEAEAFREAFGYEDLVRELAAKYPNTFGAARGMNAIVWALMHSRSHPRDIADYCLQSIQCGKNCGDLFTASVAYGPLLWNLQVQGADLDEIQNYVAECLAFSNRYHLPFSAGLARATQAGWLDPMKTDDAALDRSETLAQWERDNHIASAGSYYVHRALAHYYLGEHAASERLLEGARKYLTGLTDSVLKRQWHVFRILNAIRSYEQGRRFRSEPELQAHIQPLIRQVERWTALGPLLKPYLALVQAEFERVAGDFKEARSLYLDAIAIAAEQGYVFLEGYLNECLGDLLLAAGQDSARVYFNEAVRLYGKCHARRKVMHLMATYPGEVAAPPTESTPVNGEAITARTLPDLDSTYLMKSSLSISAEIDLDALLKQIMNTVIESSGAQRGYLLVADDGSLFVRAESHIGQTQAAVTLNQDLEDAQGISKAIVRYVYRTGERVLLGDAGREGLFRDNPEVRAMQLRSIFCLPVIKQSRMIGVLYLENRLAGGVFTPKKAQMTELLTSQAAISLENASLLMRHRQAEEQIRKSLEEKEVLLKEIHHRVKNNLQIIHSMLNLQLPHIEDAKAIELFKESQNRVYTMALIHEKLYLSESLARIDLAEYLRSLIAYLFLSYGARDQDTQAKVSVRNVVLDLDTVIPCALIINELVSNALKHAFPESRSRAAGPDEIRIDLHHGTGNEWHLAVSDNGIGWPAGLDIEQSQSLGMKLIRALVRQLHGTIQISANRVGTEFSITFNA